MLQSRSGLGGTSGISKCLHSFVEVWPIQEDSLPIRRDWRKQSFIQVTQSPRQPHEPWIYVLNSTLVAHIGKIKMLVHEKTACLVADSVAQRAEDHKTSDCAYRTESLPHGYKIKRQAVCSSLRNIPMCITSAILVTEAIARGMQAFQ